MHFRRLAAALLATLAVPAMALADPGEDAGPMLGLELNAMRDVGQACRLSFLTRNLTGATIERAVFEAVIFDRSGGVVSLSLFDFRDLPTDRPRVRQFQLPDMACDTIGQALINGANSCVVDGIESTLCADALSLSSRIDVELLG